MNLAFPIPVERPLSRNRWAAGVAVLLFALSGSLQATLVPRMSLEEIVDASESIVHGKVLRSWSAWDEGHKYIWTHYEVQVTDRLKGGPLGTIVISEPGGIVGETALQIAGTPQYETGEEVVLFAERTPLGYLRTCGWGQGKFRVDRSGQRNSVTVRSAARGIQLVERPPAGELKSVNATPLGEVSGLDLEQFKSRVRQMIQQRASQAR